MMNPLTTMRLIGTRELLERVKSKAFLISTAFIVVLIAGAIIVPTLLDDDDANRLEVV